MRFPIAALYLIVASFIFFVMFAVTSLLLSEVGDALEPLASDLGESTLDNILTVVPLAFGIISAIFFVSGILLIFFLESTADEYELYYRR